jgi:23S rRNA (cytosine1962-C5)-methyltransferase
VSARAPGGGRPRARLGKPLRAAIRAGHPWIYDRALPALPAGARAGDVVAIWDDDGPVCAAMVDPASPIRARVLDDDPDAVIDAAWAHGRARAAAAARVADPMLADSDGWRLVHGENDALPGLTLDRYGEIAVAVFDGEAAAALWRPLLPAVLDGCREAGVTLAGAWSRGARGRGGKGEALGDVPAAPVVMHERAARFAVDVRAGQKTGFFLDQRHNRALIGAHAAGATVLNLCCYTGGFSVHAALGGARRVTSVDLAAPAVAAVADNLARSGVDASAHEAVCADAFDFLDQARARGRRWDIVIVDPPSFAPSEKARGQALRAYQRLNALALEVVEPGGLIASASCSSHVTEADLLGVLAGAGAQTRRRVRLRHVLGAASDHPVLPAFPEGRYLSFLLGDVA